MSPSLAAFHALPRAERSDVLTRCNGSRAWVEGMLAVPPAPSLDALLRQADEVWSRVGDADVLEAISHHPKIGDLDALRKKYAASQEAGEQSGVQGASDDVLRRLQEGNRVYEARFGFIFLVFATGKSAAQMLALLEERLGHTREEELRIARGEQAKITRLRLERHFS